MRYLLISMVGTETNTPFEVYLEDGNKVTLASGTKEDQGMWLDVVKDLDITSLEDVIEKQHFSYFTTEIGDYSGEDKTRIDKIISDLT